MALIPQNTQPSQFYLDGQPITAKKVKQLHPRRKTVHRLELEPGSFRHTIPSSVTTVIVKQQKDGWEEEFQLEKEAYEKLNELQGIVIPQLYGPGSFNGLPALILSDVAGISLYDLAHNKEVQEKFLEVLETRLTEALKKLYEHQAEHWDQKLDNFIFCHNGNYNNRNFENGKVVIVDLEDVQFPDKIGPWEANVNLGGVGYLMSDFRDARDRKRELSSARLWLTKPNDGDALDTTELRGPTRMTVPEDTKELNLIAPLSQ